jgi:ribonuclease P/MRP protein subunit POP5
MVRFKNRYILAEVVWQDSGDATAGGATSTVAPGAGIGATGSISRGDVTGFIILNTIKDSIQENFGDVGMGRVLGSLQVKYYNPISGACIVRVSRDEFQNVWSAMSFVRRIRKREGIFRVLHVGGTIRSCQKYAVKHGKETLSLIARGKRTLAQREAGDKLLQEMETEILALEV